MGHPTVIITGASRGLGAATAQATARFGANVVLSARSLPALQNQVQQIIEVGSSAIAIEADISRSEDCHRLIQHTLDHFGSVDALINNAGMIEPIAKIAEVDLTNWEKNWFTNFFAPLRLSQLALPYLRQSHGHLINITSGASTAVIQGWGAYSTAKAAIDHLTRILAQEEPEITALVVRPGIMDTDMQGIIRDKGLGEMSETDYNRLFGLYAQGKLVSPGDSGMAIALLALYAPHAWSGKLLQWDDPQVPELANAISGNPPML